LSRLGERVSHMVCQCEISDPMSGFFVFRRSFFTEVVHRLHGGGFKILVDMLAAAERPVQLAEVGYTFRKRRYGESKLDVNTAVEFLLLIVDRLTNCLIPVRLAAFSLVGAAGVFTHMGCLALLMFGWRWQFVPAQIASTYLAMTGNFFLSNLLTSRDRSLRGMGLIGGLMTYCLACSLGAWANVVFAHALLLSGSPWYLAGIAGIILSSVWNHSMSNLFSWNKARFPGKPSARFAQAASELNPWE
jgi:dolichol-phosphate mannosyltransferase